MGAWHAGQRYMNHVVELIWDGGDADQVARIRELFGLLVTDAAADGHGEYRTHIAFMDHVANQFDFNDHALRRLNETIKDAVDPNGILSPGKSGIWPRGMRRGALGAAQRVRGVVRRAGLVERLDHDGVELRARAAAQLGERVGGGPRLR